MRELFFYVVAMCILGYFLSFQWTRVIVNMKQDVPYVAESRRIRDLFDS